MKQRENIILEILTRDQRAEVAALAEAIGVSQVTIRKDLDALEQKGIIRREHGYAMLLNTDDISGRIAYHYESKRRIAAHAASLVRDGETVMIESGSCCTLLAEAIFDTKRDVTVITNSAFIAGYVRSKPGAKVILLGGIYQNDSQVVVGPMIREDSKDFYVDKFFIGTDGFTEGTGFTNSDQMRAQAVRDMAPSSEGIIVITESEKFARPGVVPLRIDEHVRMVITDDAIRDEEHALLTKRGVEVVLVAHADEDYLPGDARTAHADKE